MQTEKPYFMNDPNWFYFDEKEFKYKLTEKATEKARKSYEDFYKSVEESVYDD